MYFYLLTNSSFIKEQNTEIKNIKIFVYGTITYVLTHAIFFIGGSESLLYPLKNYFWVIFLLDCIVIYIIYSKLNKSNNKNMSTPFDFLIKLLNTSTIGNRDSLHNASESKTRVPVITNTIPHPSDLPKDITPEFPKDLKQTNKTPVEKKIRFQPVEPSDSESDSDFSSDIDIDMDMFKQSL